MAVASHCQELRCLAWLPAPPLAFSVIPQSPSQCEVRCKEIETIHVHKGITDPLYGMMWRFTMAPHNDANTIIVRKQLFASCANFEAADGSIITTMHQRVYNAQCSNEFAWGSNTYRWNEIRSTVPLKLQLLNVSTQEQVACLEGRLSSRHCKARHDYIRINSSSHDGTWLLLVVASGMAEASCLGIEH